MQSSQIYHQPSYNQQLFTFESPSKNFFNSNLSYGNIADAYINENFMVTSTANTAIGRLRALEEPSPLISSLDQAQIQHQDFFQPASNANQAGNLSFHNNDPPSQESFLNSNQPGLFEFNDDKWKRQFM
ncbi:UNKNOWN [Stylonychia lemnae]|uniref:Uncharacterized protein n=1 Tax=Stylonychia lemnae TaxID=5949 RepID=A0A078A0U9_STYLE|nr:UNKNOWN [Stylonychia lemnae]|eukprot:CDW74414.1 UNKNOWN [Stylonychia lemnae]